MKEIKLFWDKFSGIYDLFMRKDRRAYDKIYQLIRKSLSKDMVVLELATGTGLIALHIADKVKKVEATDFSEKMIEVAKKKPHPDNVTFSLQDACNLPYAKDSFDVVIISNALHIMPDPGKALLNIAGVLKKDGIIIAPTFTHDGGKGNPIKKLMSAIGFVTYSEWNPDSYVKFLEDHGWTIRKKEVIEASFTITYVEAGVERRYQ